MNAHRYRTRGRVLRSLTGLAALALVAGACSEGGTDDTDTGENVTTTAVAPELTPMSSQDQATLAETSNDGGCEELDAARCLLPFPSNRFTVEDSGSSTGRMVNLPEGQIPNVDGAPLDVTEWNRNDGFSPGTPFLVSAPGVDLEKSGTAPIGEIGKSTEAGSGSLLIDLTTGDVVPHWVELDLHAPEADRLVIVRPAINLVEGHDIGVYLGALVDGSGSPIEAPLGFTAYRDSLETEIPAIEDRRSEMETVISAGVDAGMDRTTMYAAWDVTVASTENLSGRLLAMRDDALERIGDGGPAFTVSEVIADDLPEGIGRRVTGTFDVPSYLTNNSEPGARINYGEDGVTPEYSGSDFAAQFTCQIPTVALDGPGGETRPVVYGHGLLGSRTEAQNSQVAKIAATNNMMYCATDWIGMAEEDIGNAVSILSDLSGFPSLPDRSQQGILNSLFMARVMTADDGFSSDPAFAATSGVSVIDANEAYYDGNSQGGIIGGAATAISTEWTKAVLGVPGMNYSTLLSRSVDFESYFAVLRGAYPDVTDQAIIYPLLSMLWDRGETNGYAAHVTDDSYPGTPAHQVILDVGFGDHQVAQVSAEVEARTMGAGVRGPALADGRHPDAAPFFGLDIIEEFPTDRSVLVYWDSGSLAPPPGNITPVSSEEYKAACDGLTEDEVDRDAQCADPHEDPRRATDSIEQKGLFFEPDGKIHDTCDAKPCVAKHRKNL